MVFGIHYLVRKLVVCRKKKDIVRHITDCKLCVVLRKCCTKAPPTKNALFTACNTFSFYKTNNNWTSRLPLPLIYRATAAPCPLPPPGAWTDKTTHMTANKPIRIFCWFVQPTCGLYGEAADLEQDRSTAQTVLHPRQFYAPVVPDVSSRGRPHSIMSHQNWIKPKSNLEARRKRGMLNTR